jgi:hypothetical protein
MFPLGKGQRALVVAPAKAGKTTLLTAMARGIIANQPEATVYILLADERPEEVTEMELANAGEVIASSFDHGAERHVAVAEMTLERARRRVELGEDGDPPCLADRVRARLQQPRQGVGPHLVSLHPRRGSGTPEAILWQRARGRSAGGQGIADHHLHRAEGHRI